MAGTKGFDYTEAVRTVCADMVLRIPEFLHVDLEKIGFSFCRTRNREMYGAFAAVFPLRFEGGKSTLLRNGVLWRIPDVFDRQKKQLLYILAVYVPRFINLPLLDKIDTLVHELYHIGPNCDGDIRRFGNRFYAHGASKTEYNKTTARLAREWLQRDPPPEIWDFLRYDFATLAERFGKIVGRKIPVPKITRES